MNSFRATLLAIVCAAPALCVAQWQWIDKDGRKVFSDQPPSADVPTKNILKQPGGGKARIVDAAPVGAASPASAASQPAKAAVAGSAPKLSGKEKELEARKKQAEAAEAEKKKAQEEEVAKAKADNCERARRSKASLDSGVRIAQTNAKGEREILNDAQRAAELKHVEATIARDCKPAQ